MSAPNYVPVPTGPISDDEVNLPIQLQVDGGERRVIAAPATLGSAPDDTFSFPGSDLAPHHLSLEPAWVSGRSVVWVENHAPERAVPEVRLGRAWREGERLGCRGGLSLTLAGYKLRFTWQPPPPTVEATYEGFVGRSAPMRELYARLDALAPGTEPVVVLGSYSVRQLAFQALHARSGRPGTLEAASSGYFAGRWWVTLVGQTADAFPGAKAFLGSFGCAEGGTLALDDMERPPRELVARLEQYLDHGTALRHGSSTPFRPDVRLLFGCARDEYELNRTVAADALLGRFKHRTVVIPDLHDCLEDLEELLPFLTERHESGAGVRWTPEAVRAVRETRPPSYDAIESQLSVLLGNLEEAGRAKVTPADVRGAFNLPDLKPSVRRVTSTLH